LAKDGQAQEWWNDYRDVIQGDKSPDHLSTLVALESAATQICTFQPDVIYGLLQTAEYVEEVSAAAYPEMSDAERRRFVEFRLSRQRVLTAPGRGVALRCVLDESALLRAFVGRRVHERQLRALHDRLQDDLVHVDFHILPLQVAIPEAVGGPFVIFHFEHSEDQDVVLFEGREGVAYVEGADGASRYGRIFETLCNRSLSRTASLVRLKELASSAAPT
jgi:hypothetical protein